MASDALVISCELDLGSHKSVDYTLQWPRPRPPPGVQCFVCVLFVDFRGQWGKPCVVKACEGTGRQCPKLD